MNSVIAVVKEAAQKAAEHMTTEVRTSARQSGWPSSVAKSIMVTSTDTGFQLTADDNAMDWEYGNLSQTPTGAIRKFKNRTGSSEAALIKEVMATLKTKGIL